MEERIPDAQYYLEALSFRGRQNVLGSIAFRRGIASHGSSRRIGSNGIKIGFIVRLLFGASIGVHVAKGKA